MMGLHDFNSTGLASGELGCSIDCAEVAVADGILNLIFFHSVDSLY